MTKWKEVEDKGRERGEGANRARPTDRCTHRYIREAICKHRYIHTSRIESEEKSRQSNDFLNKPSKKGKKNQNELFHRKHRSVDAIFKLLTRWTD